MIRSPKLCINDLADMVGVNRYFIDNAFRIYKDIAPKPVLKTGSGRLSNGQKMAPRHYYDKTELINFWREVKRRRAEKKDKLNKI